MLGKIFVHHRYGVLTRNISTSHWKLRIQKPGLEISQWLEKKIGEEGKTLSLKYKASIKFEVEKNNMSTFKKI